MLNPGNKFLYKIYDKLNVTDKAVVDDRVCLVCNIIAALAFVAGITAITMVPFVPYM